MSQHRSGASVLGAGRPLSRGGRTSQELCRAASGSSHLLLRPQTQLLQKVGCLHNQVALIIYRGKKYIFAYLVQTVDSYFFASEQLGGFLYITCRSKQTPSESCCWGLSHCVVQERTLLSIHSVLLGPESLLDLLLSDRLFLRAFMGCAGFTCSKHSLCVLNILYVVVGGIIGVGVFLFFVALAGLIGAMKHHQCLLSHQQRAAGFCRLMRIHGEQEGGCFVELKKQDNSLR
ncbi:hypothetical protein FQN60_007639 [Etheostoma spectabile]|uniref:Uncharacterized protein n=1 Tax=Etheostoma spectabile TaxID=54343 RepID=A0A5J5CZN6_9PERO|nr:hypothetical protein FQN60_007639 [Etheostoma spectabile]